jgi:hypothetical protein
MRFASANIGEHKYAVGRAHSAESLQRPLLSHVRINDSTAHVSDSVRRLRRPNFGCCTSSNH